MKKTRSSSGGGGGGGGGSGSSAALGGGLALAGLLFAFLVGYLFHIFTYAPAPAGVGVRASLQVRGHTLPPLQPPQPPQQPALRGSDPPPRGMGITMHNLVPRYAALYERYKHELRELHGVLRELCTRIACLSDDMEVEATYMRVREAQPDVLWEISPHAGYCTVVLLTALKRNGKGAMLSFDLEDDVSQNLPKELTEGGRWQLVVGDFSKTYSAYGSQRPDYLFLDSMHTADFGRFNTVELFPWLGAGHLFVSLHDVYNPGFWSDNQLRRDPAVYPCVLAPAPRQRPRCSPPGCCRSPGPPPRRTHTLCLAHPPRAPPLQGLYSQRGGHGGH